MFVKPILLLTLALMVGCNVTGSELSPQEEALIATVKMERGMAAKAKSSGVSIERLTAVTPDYHEAPADGIVVNTRPKRGRVALAEMRDRLAGTPYRAYLLDDAFGTGPDKVAVVKRDDYGYLAIVRTDGINHDLDHSKVMERYKRWDAKYGLKLVGAGQDWLEAEFRNPPGDWLAFAKEVYEFCPDVVDQGTGEVSVLAKEMEKSNTVYLWWD
ncbi:DUF4253 domain-containing protein [Lysobacter sp. CFH 32150]|uniref:DUF4253 domain-containing protein n=1 Tax=Lysobacter sp. CFH 32150 TaxID=2927128 RepID=UPI001FA77662|nr:DUF4253 domain-containing protein [Lysobacter sp. CFH 32150]MCI4568062.1 DUF4253 domain-containing protein [Lysobacter sp. CFH 32150]